jgi:hypothetical protein
VGHAQERVYGISAAAVNNAAGRAQETATQRWIGRLYNLVRDEPVTPDPQQVRIRFGSRRKFLPPLRGFGLQHRCDRSVAAQSH